jgi:hypothetical protein
MENMRFTVAGEASPLKDVVMRALMETGGWSVAAMRTPGFRNLARVLTDEGNFRTLAPLPDNSQKIIDTAVVEVGLQRLTFVADLLAEGLVYNLPDPLSVTQLEWNAMSKVGAAQRTMSPSARGENKLPIMLPSRLPIYLTTDQFELDIRTLKMSQRVGTPLDTALIKQCTRSVNEALEDAGINGATTLDGQDLVVAGYSAPGLVNAPNANVQTLTAAAWTTAPVGTTITAEILAMVTKLQADLKFGPYNLYVPTAVGIALNTDYKANGNDSILVRLQQIMFGGRPLRVRTTDMMPSTKVVLVQMTSDVVEVVNGRPPTVIPWTSLDGFTIHNLVMAIMIPRVRSDYNGNSGVCIGTLT